MLLGILFSNLGLLSTSSFFPLWTFLVVNTLSTLGWLSSRLPSHNLATYFLASCVGGTLFLLGSFPNYFYPIVFSVGLLLSIGFPPFQFWVLPLLCSLDLLSILLLLGPFKLGTLYIILSYSQGTWFLTLVPLLSGFLILFTSTSIGFILFASSSCQLIFLFILGQSQFFYYYFFYLFSIYLVYLSVFGALSPLLAFGGLAGIPPLSLFWGKAFALCYLPLSGAVLLLIISALTSYPYLILGVTFTLRSASSRLMLDLLYYIPPLLFLVLTYWIV